MLKKSRRRLEILIISVLIVIFLGMLASIYVGTYIDIKKENHEMMEIYAMGFSKNGMPNGDGIRDDTAAKPITLLPTTTKHDTTRRRYQVSNFYAVAFDLEGNVTGTDNDVTSGISDEDLENIANILVAKNKTEGVYENFAYLVDSTDTYILVVLVDNTILSSTINSLVHSMLIFGGVAIVLLIILSKFLIKWVMHPVEESYEKQKQFISDAGHELKTPISTIETNTALLERSLGQNKWLDNIKYENKRMSDMVRELLDLARIENVSPVMEDVDFSRIILATTLPFEAGAFEKGIEFKYDLPDTFVIKGDKKQLEKLCSILIDNALSHCNSSGQIEIKLSSIKNKAVFSVSNPGEEIPVSQREKIFERFYRMDEAREHKEGHYGLGLSIAKNIALAHKGDIKVECNNGYVSFIVTV